MKNLKQERKNKTIVYIFVINYRLVVINSKDIDNQEDKNVYNPRAFIKKGKKRYISSIEADINLQETVRQLSITLNLSQKDVLTKAILDLAVKVQQKHPNITEYLSLLDERLKKLIYLNIDPEKISKEDEEKVTKSYHDHIALAHKYSPKEFKIIQVFLKRRIMELKQMYGYDPDYIRNSFDGMI